MRKTMHFASPVIAALLMLLTTGAANAHGPSEGRGYGPGMMGPGMMGPGMMQGYGPGMMGPGMMQGHGPGMMGPGMMQGYGPGVMQGYGPGMMMGPGMMQGYQRQVPTLPQDLSADDVQRMMEQRLAWANNPNLKLGKVEAKNDDVIVAEIVTKDGSLVQRWEVNRHTGWMQPAQ